MTAGTGIDVSIIMPCLNEAATLPQCLEEAQAALDILQTEDNLSGEIVIADNGSTDGSIEIAQAAGVRVIHIDKKGYGHALVGGVAATYGRYIVMGDSDLSYDFRDAVPIVRKLVDGYELCMGNRFKGQIMPGAMPWKNRYIGNPLLSGILNLLFRSGLGDAHAGLRGFRRDAFMRMGLTSGGMEFASEMVIKATLLDLKRTEVPITLRPDGRDRSPHLRPWRDGWRHLRYIFMLSPAWLFFGPSLVFGLLGIVIFLALLLNTDQKMVNVGPFLFGNHWMILSVAFVIASHQTALFGLTTTLHGIRSGYRQSTPALHRIFRILSLENMLIAGTILITLGGFILFLIFADWSSRGFGSLSQFREMLAASTIALIGMQTFFGGFLLSIVAGNEARIHESISNSALQQNNYTDRVIADTADTANYTG